MIDLIKELDSLMDKPKPVVAPIFKDEMKLLVDKYKSAKEKKDELRFQTIAPQTDNQLLWYGGVSLIGVLLIVAITRRKKGGNDI